MSFDIKVAFCGYSNALPAMGYACNTLARCLKGALKPGQQQDAFRILSSAMSSCVFAVPIANEEELDKVSLRTIQGVDF